MALSDTLKDELRQILENGDFTPTVAYRISQLARQAGDILLAIKPLDIADTIPLQTYGSPSSTSTIGGVVAYSPAETYGNRMLQELIKGFSKMRGDTEEKSIEILTNALATAKTAGLTNQVHGIEKRLNKLLNENVSQDSKEEETT